MSVLLLVGCLKAQPPISALPQRSVNFGSTPLPNGEGPSWPPPQSVLNTPCTDGNYTTVNCTWSYQNPPSIWTADGDAQILENVFKAYKPGDIVLVTAGQTYRPAIGSLQGASVSPQSCSPGGAAVNAYFYIPGKAQTVPPKWSYVMTSAWNDPTRFPPPNTRIDPSYSVTHWDSAKHPNGPGMFKLSLQGQQSAGLFCLMVGASYTRIVGGEFFPETQFVGAATKWARGFALESIWAPGAGAGGRRWVKASPSGGTSLQATSSFMVDVEQPRFDFWLSTGTCTSGPPANLKQFGILNFPSDNLPHIVCVQGSPGYNGAGATHFTAQSQVVVGAQAVYKNVPDVVVGTPVIDSPQLMEVPVSFPDGLTNWCPSVPDIGNIPGTVCNGLGIHFMRVTTYLGKGVGSCILSPCWEDAWSEVPIIPVGSAGAPEPRLQAICRTGTGPGPGCDNTLISGTDVLSPAAVSIPAAGGTVTVLTSAANTVPNPLSVDWVSKTITITSANQACTTAPQLQLLNNGVVFATVPLTSTSETAVGFQNVVAGTSLTAHHIAGTGCTVAYTPVTVKLTHQLMTSFTIYGNPSGPNQTHFLSNVCLAQVTNNNCSEAVIDQVFTGCQNGFGTAGIPCHSGPSTDGNGSMVCDPVAQTCTFYLTAAAGFTGSGQVQSGSLYFAQSAVSVVTGNNFSKPGILENAPLYKGLKTPSTVPHSYPITYPLASSTGCYLDDIYPNHHQADGIPFNAVITQAEPYAGTTTCTRWTAANCTLANGCFDFTQSLYGTVGSANTYPTTDGITLNNVTIDSPECAAKGYATGYCATINMTVSPGALRDTNHIILDRVYDHGDAGTIKNCAVDPNPAHATGNQLAQTQDPSCYTATVPFTTPCGQVMTAPGFFSCGMQLVVLAMYIDSGYFGVTDSLVEDIYPDNIFESHGMSYAFNSGPMTWKNNMFHNIATEAIFSGSVGGIANQSISNPSDLIYGDPECLSGLCTPAQGAIGSNYFFRDFWYFPLCNRNVNNNNPSYFACKNVLEQKNARRGIYNGDVLINTFNAAQGSAYTLTVSAGVNGGTVASNVSDIQYVNNFVKFIPSLVGFIDTDRRNITTIFCTTANGCHFGQWSQYGLGWGGYSLRDNWINNWVGAMDTTNFYNGIVNTSATKPVGYGIQFPNSSEALYYRNNTWIFDPEYQNLCAASGCGGPVRWNGISVLRSDNTVQTCGQYPTTPPNLYASTHNLFVWDNAFVGDIAQADGCGGAVFGSASGDGLLFSVAYYDPASPQECNAGQNDSRQVRLSGNMYYAVPPVGGTSWNVQPGCNNSAIGQHYPNQGFNGTANTSFTFDTTGPSYTTYDGYTVYLNVSKNVGTGVCTSASTTQDWSGCTHNGNQVGVDGDRLSTAINRVAEGYGLHLGTSSGSLAPMQIGAPYNAPVFAVLGSPPYTYSASPSSFCGSLSLSSDGYITGTPTSACSVTITATDALGATASKLLLLAGGGVAPPPPPPAGGAAWSVGSIGPGAAARTAPRTPSKPKP